MNARVDMRDVTAAITTLGRSNPPVTSLKESHTVLERQGGRRRVRRGAVTSLKESHTVLEPSADSPHAAGREVTLLKQSHTVLQREMDDYQVMDALVKHLLLPTDQPTVTQYEKPKTLADGGETADD